MCCRPSNPGLFHFSHHERENVINATLKDVVNAVAALERIGQEKLPAKAAWRVSRLLAKMQSEQRAYMKVREGKFKELGVTSDGQTYTVPPENMKQLNDQLEAVLSEPVKIDYKPIPLGLFGEATLAPADLALVTPFITEQED